MTGAARVSFPEKTLPGSHADLGLASAALAGRVADQAKIDVVWPGQHRAGWESCRPGQAQRGFGLASVTLAGNCRPGQDPVRVRVKLRSGELDQREGPVPARRDEEVLPPGGCDEPLQAVVVGLVAEELVLQILRRHGDAHLSEQV